MNLNEITRPTQISYKELCNLYNLTPIIVSKNKASKEKREQQINYINSLYEGEIKYNSKKRTYIIIPPFTKKDLTKQQQLQEAREKGLTVVLHSGEEIIATSHNAITKTGFQDYIYYMTRHFYGNTKSEFFLMCLHPIAFYNRIFNNYYPYDEIDGFTYLTKTSMYHPSILIAGRNLIFKRLASYITSALENLVKNDYIDILEKYETHQGKLVDLDTIQQYTIQTLAKLGYPSENIALEKNKQKFMEERDLLFQEAIRKGEINYIDTSQNHLTISKRIFTIFQGNKINLNAYKMAQEDLLNILDDFCKVVQIRLKNDFAEKKIIIAQEEKGVDKFGYKFEEQVANCYLDYITLDRNSFISPEQFQQQHYEDKYSIYMMKSITDKAKLNRIISYREQCRKDNKKGEGLK